MRVQLTLACLLGISLFGASHAAFATTATLQSGAARPGLKHMCMTRSSASSSAPASSSTEAAKRREVNLFSDAASGPISRRALLGASAGMLLGIAAPVVAEEKKMTGLSNAELAKAVEKDVVQVSVAARFHQAAQPSSRLSRATAVNGGGRCEQRW